MMMYSIAIQHGNAAAWERFRLILDQIIYHLYRAFAIVFITVFLVFIFIVVYIYLDIIVHKLFNSTKPQLTSRLLSQQNKDGVNQDGGGVAWRTRR